MIEIEDPVITGLETKVCSKCDELKLLIDFPKDRSIKSGYRGVLLGL